MRSRTYFLICVGGCLVLMAFLTVVNLRSDPFGLWQVRRGEEKEVWRTGIVNHARLLKAHQLAQGGWQGLVMGSSRAGIGLPADHESLGGKRVFNCGLPNANIRELRVHLDHAMAYNDLKLVVIGLDLYMFNGERAVQVDFDPDRLASTGSRFASRKALSEDLLTSLFSWNALSAGWTSEDSASEDAYWFSSRGNILGAESMLDRGHRRLFHEFGVRNMRGCYFPWPSQRFTFACPDEAEQTTFDELGGMLTACRERGIRTRVFFSPNHAWLYEIFAVVGLWPTFESWKAEVTRVVDSQTREGEGGDWDVELWDFARYHPITNEPVPPAEEPGQRMRGFYEYSHYTPWVGGQVLRRMLTPSEGGEGGFGWRLTPANLEEALETNRESRDRYRLQHPELRRELLEMDEASRVTRRQP